MTNDIFDRTDPLNAACIAVGEELMEAHGWSIGDDADEADSDCMFYQVLQKHFGPLCRLSSEERRQARIAALEGELAALRAQQIGGST